MSKECFRLDALGSLLDLDPEDPRRRHLAHCPRCRARLAAYRTFLSEGPPLAGSRPDEAKLALERYIETMAQSAVEPKTKSGFWVRLRECCLRRPVLVPALVAAAAVVLIVVLRPFPSGDRSPAPLRNIEGLSPASATLRIQPAVLGEGVVTFVWTSVPAADRYEVMLFDTQLEEIARFDAKRDTSIRIATSRIPRMDEPLLWRVVAYREGEACASSPIGSLDLRGR